VLLRIFAAKSNQLRFLRALLSFPEISGTPVHFAIANPYVRFIYRIHWLRLECVHFLDCKDLIINAPEGSYAETYAKENNIPFETKQTDPILLFET
jgi:hypothetical protein